MSGRTLSRTPGTPSIIMSPDHRPWTQIRALARPDASPAPRSLTGAANDLNHNVSPPPLADRVYGGPSSASRSFVLAALWALHLDPDCRPTILKHGRERGQNERKPTDSHLYGGPQHR